MLLFYQLISTVYELPSRPFSAIMSSQFSHSTDIRWLPTISFSHLPHSSSPSTIPAALRSSSSSSSSSSFSAAGFDPHHPKKKPSGDATREARIFGNGKKTNRVRKLRPIGEHDGNNDEDNVMPNSFDRTCIRSNTTSSSTILPRPLPSPDAFLRPQGMGPGLIIGVRGAEEHAGAVEEVLPPFRMRSVFANQETRRNARQVETRSCGKVNQDQMGGYRGAQDKFCISVPNRSAQSSPFASPTTSPKKTRNGDFVPYHYVTPKGKQSWSAPAMPTSEALAGVPPAFFDTSLRPSTPGRSPRKNSKSPSDALSPIHTKLSLEISTACCENNAPVSVHPLPLPPGAALPSTPPNFSQAMPKSDSLSMKCQWQKGKLIGRGTFGSVFVATNRETGALCAMKEVEIFPDDPKSAECMKQLEQEIKVLSQLKHPNIVQYYGSEIVEDRFYIYLEYVHPGSINRYVREHCGAITEAVVRNFTRHILSGLAYLHSKKTIHRDIKGANLLVDSAGCVKLADFGMAKHLTGHVVDLSLKGSPYWMAPELMQAVMHKDSSSDLAFAVDIWSLGCTIIEMFTGKSPWSEYEGAAAMFKVMKDTPPLPETLSTEGKDFLRCCFKRNPAERATAAMLLEHRFLKNSQQLDAPSSTQPHNVINLMDRRYSLRGLLESKANQLSIPKVQIAKREGRS